MSMESCVKVKEEPRSSFRVDVCIKKETEWGEGAEEELGPAWELGCLLSDHASTLHDCVKAEPSGYEIASSGDFSEAAMPAGLYSDPVVKDELVPGPGRAQNSPSCLHGVSEAAVLGGLCADHVVKDELVLGPECILKPHVAAVPRAVGQPLLRECSVRLERVAVPPSLSVPPAPAPSSPGPRRSRRPRAPARAASPDYTDHDVHTSIEKKQICHICGRRYALKSNLRRHVKVHIHTGPWICMRTQEEHVSDSDEEIDVVSLDPPGPLLAAMLLHTSMDYLPRDSDTHYEPKGHKSTAKWQYRSKRNDNERLRRSSLRKLFDELRKQIPATRNNERPSYTVILREAVSLCRQLRKERDLKEEELESLKKQQNKLLAKLKGERVSQPSINKWSGSGKSKLYKSYRQNACLRRKRRCVT